MGTGCMNKMKKTIVKKYRKEKLLENIWGEGGGVFFYGIGLSVYAFKGIGMILPLESEAKDKEKFDAVLGLWMGLIS